MFIHYIFWPICVSLYNILFIIFKDGPFIDIFSIGFDNGPREIFYIQINSWRKEVAHWPEVLLLYFLLPLFYLLFVITAFWMFFTSIIELFEIYQKWKKK